MEDNKEPSKEQDHLAVVEEPRTPPPPSPTKKDTVVVKVGVVGDTQTGTDDLLKNLVSPYVLDETYIPTLGIFY